MQQQDLRWRTVAVKVALLSTLLALPLSAQAFTCLNESHTIDLNNTSNRDFSDGDSDVVWGTDDADVVEVDQCDIVCGNDGNDEIEVRYSDCTLDSGVEFPGLDGGNGDDEYFCFTGCTVPSNGDGDGNDTMYVHSADPNNREGGEGDAFAFWALGGNDRVAINGLDTVVQTVIFFSGGSGTDTLDCNGREDGNPNEFAVTGTWETTTDCPGM